MNKVELMGRITADPELNYTSNNKAYVRFTLAVNRNYKTEDGETPADFISCVAWEKIAELISEHIRKGNRMLLEGKIQTGSYDKEDGSRGYLEDVIVERFYFIDSKAKDGRPAPEEQPIASDDPFADFGDSVQITDDEMPF